MPRSLGVVIPAFNPDVPVLESYVHAIDTELAPSALRIELDAPQPGVPEALADLPGVVNTYPVRRGKGAAITDGFQRLSTDVLAFADADASTPVPSFTDVTAPVREGTAALAVGSRRHPDAIVKAHQTYGRRRLGDLFARVARYWLGVPIHDFQCGAKAITLDAWEEVSEHLYEPGFAWDVELIGITHALGYQLAEVPIVWDDHPRSTVGLPGVTRELGRALLNTRKRAALLRDPTDPDTMGEPPAGRPALVERNRLER